MSVGNKVRIVGIESFKAFKDQDGLTDSAVTITDEEFYDDYFIVDTIGVGASNYFTAQVQEGTYWSQEFYWNHDSILSQDCLCFSVWISYVGR